MASAGTRSWRQRRIERAGEVMINNLKMLGISWHEVLETAEDSQSWRGVTNNNRRMLVISWHEVLETAEDS